MANIVKVLKALSDPTRLDMVRQLLQCKGEVSCQSLCECFDLSQPTLSHHINKLSDAGILSIRKDGVCHYYSINAVDMKKIGLDMPKLVSSLNS